MAFANNNIAILIIRALSYRSKTPPRQAGDRPPPLAAEQGRWPGRPADLKHKSRRIRQDPLSEQPNDGCRCLAAIAIRSTRGSRQPRRAHVRDEVPIRGQLLQAAAAHSLQAGVSHAHTGQFGTFVGIAAISSTGNSKAARRSAQKRIFAGSRLTLHFSTLERSRQSAV
jgi:hypothetical protein